VATRLPARTEYRTSMAHHRESDAGMLRTSIAEALSKLRFSLRELPVNRLQAHGTGPE
jgi:hypothetical protein